MMKNELKSTSRVEALDRLDKIRVPAGELGAVLELIVRNKKGEITERQVMVSKSFIKQFLQGLWMCCAFVWTNWPVEIRQTDGTIQILRCDTNSWLCSAPANNTSYGVLRG